MIQRAPNDVRRRVNGQPPNGSHYLPQGTVKQLEMFSAASIKHWGRLHFAEDVVGKPPEGRVVRQNAGGYGQKGPVVLPASSDELQMSMRRRMSKDPQISIGLAALKAPIMAAFEAIRVDCRDPVIKGFMQQVLMKEYGGILRRAVFRALQSLEFGYVAHEKIWRNGVTVEFQVDTEQEGEPANKTMENCTVLEDISDLDPRYTEILVDGESGEYAGIQYGWSTDQRLPAEKSWLVTHDKRFGNYRGNACMDRVYNPWYWCDIMYLFCNRYYERKASPPIKGRAPSVVTDDNGEEVTGVTLFTNMLNSLISDGICVLPSEKQGEGGRNEDYVWDVEFMMDDKRGEMFIRYIEHLQTLKLRGIWLPEMVVERGAPAGTYGMAKSHVEFLVDLLTLILNEILEHINLYLVPDIVTHNFGSGAPPCSIDTLTKIGDRRDLLEQLVIELIRAESRVGGLDTTRIIDIISLLRQLNVDVGRRRNLTDYQHQVEQEDKSLKIAEKAANAKTIIPKEKPSGAPKVTPSDSSTRPRAPGLKNNAIAASQEERLDNLEKIVLDIHEKLFPEEGIE